jgi:hypothetical protein
MSTAKAFVRDEWERNGVRVLVGLTGPDGQLAHTLSWGPSVSLQVREGTGVEPEGGLQLSTDVARAVYEALADHFGHSGHDTRALRRDYEAERGRVDKMLAHLIGRSS